MAEQIYIGNFGGGQKTNKTAFNIDNDSFPNLFNFYCWRGRILRKRGTRYLGQLTIQVVSVSSPTLPYQHGPLTLVGGEGNLLVFLGLTATPNAITGIIPGVTTVVTITGQTFTIGQVVQIVDVGGMTELNGNYYTILSTGTNTITLNINSTAFIPYTSGGNAYQVGEATITPGTISLVSGGQTYTEPSSPNGTLVGSGGGTGTINYVTGEITITGGGSSTVTGTFSYYPGLPVMGLEDLEPPPPATASSNPIYPVQLSFDTVYSYQVNSTSTANKFYNVNYYITGTPFFWNGANYQQFWTTNYSGALWATNSNPGMHIMQATYDSGSPGTTITFTFRVNGAFVTNLLVGDVLWFNEWAGAGVTINKITGTISANGSAASGTYTVTFLTSQTVSGTGVTQVLTNSVTNNVGGAQDGIRYYTGDPTATTGLPLPVLNNLGWVNFAPPLTNVLPPSGVSIDNTTPAVYYLVGALAILPYKDRLLFFNAYIQTSTGVPIQLQDTVVWSWDGTPYYTVTGPSSATNPSTVTYTPTANVVPAGETASPYAYVVDQTGLGGYLPAGISQPIVTISNNQDVLMVGFGGDGRKTRFAFTGNDLQPFLFLNINSELPSQSTFSAVALDKGVIDIGQYGIAITDQQTSQRIDLDIPDSVFQIRALDFGAQRVNAIRDFFREWIYFAYPTGADTARNDNTNTATNITTSGPIPCVFPTQSFLFNYRDNTWSILYENFTAHGTFRPTRKKSWLTTGYSSWNNWREPWNSGAASPQFPSIIGGNPEGYVLIKDQGTSEAISGTISALQPYSTPESVKSGLYQTQITSYNHCLTNNNPGTGNGDYVQITGVLGLLTSPITGITSGVGPNKNETLISTVNTFIADQYITISGVVGMTQLNGNTYRIEVATGTSITINVDSRTFTPWVSGGTVTSAINGLVGEVVNVLDVNNFVIDIIYPVFATPSIGYIGLANFIRLSQPILQTKQFPVYWNEGRQVRLGRQMYLLETTTNGQVTLNIYLSQNPSSVWNSPFYNPPPNSLEYSQILYTCPESTNLGLTPANINLQTPTADASTTAQIWHRINTSLIGESIQIGITLSEKQMRNPTFATSEIILHGIQLSVEKGPYLS
jgi:ubiquitin-activating enzyme E1-like protein